MAVQFIKLSTIRVAENRFRKTFGEEAMSDLQMALQTGLGLINPITLTPDLTINTGERRFRSFQVLNDLGVELLFNGNPIPPGTIPAIIISDTADEIDVLKAELAENEAREGFTFLEKSQAITRIAMLEQQILNKMKSPDLPVTPIEDIRDISKEAIKLTAAKVYEDKTGGYYDQAVKDSLVITAAMETNTELASKLKKADSMTEAKKILDKHIKEEQRAVLANTVGKHFQASMHTLINGDCLEELPKLKPASFDVCVCDPVYGINAHKFQDAAGRRSNFDHSYEDTYENFVHYVGGALLTVSKLLKRDAHIYLACDIRNYFKLRELLTQSNQRDNPWKIPNHPIIQYKVGGGQVVHPGYTFRRSWEMWLYAYRGDKQENHLINDVIECESDRTETHGAAKPIELLKTFLKRSAKPGDHCLDFMAGSGGIVSACHDLHVRCTAIELNKAYYGRMIERLKELK